MAFEIPDACTLPTDERPIRLAEFYEVLTNSVRSADRESPTHLTLRLHGGEDLGETVRDLAAREAECCSFFDFVVTADGGDVVLGIGVPRRYASILDSLQALSRVIA